MNIDAATRNILVVVDMQNDFITGALENADAMAIVADVEKRVEDARKSGEKVIWTKDTHDEDYLDTQEGRKLPVAHCIRGTHGWEIASPLSPHADEDVYEKETFGCTRLFGDIRSSAISEGIPQSELTITLVGICTDICVISNAMLAKAFLPEARIVVEEKCCAGVCPNTHETALKAMEGVQIEVIREELDVVAPELTD